MPDTGTPPGTRVFAIRAADDSTVYLFGRGVWDGRQPISDAPVPDPLPQHAIDQATRDEAWWDDNHDCLVDSNVEAMRGSGATQDEIDTYLAEAAARHAARPPLSQRILAAARRLAGPPTTYRITLDTGQYVYGLQCWWAPEERYEEVIAGRGVVLVDVEPINGWLTGRGPRRNPTGDGESGRA
jgi:hypothetical protein